MKKRAVRKIGKSDIVIMFLICIIVVGFATAAGTDVINLRDWTKVQIVDPLESNGGIPVNIQDQTSTPVDLYFLQAIGPPTTLTNTTSINSINIIVDSVASISVGNYLGIFSGVSAENRFYFGEVLAVNGNNITLDTPLDFNFSAGDAVISTTRDLNVDGSTTKQSFIVRGAGTASPLEIDITRLIFQITDNSAMDDGLFGALPSLTNGIVLRRNNGQINNIYNIKNNGDFGLVAFDKDYSDKAPAGLFGLTVRSTFAGQSKHGVAIRLGVNESLELLIQDDLTGLNSFRILAQGHIVTD